MRDERSEKLLIIDEIIKEGLADTMDMYGGSRSVGQIYAILYMNGGPMTLDELRDETGMSKGSMSLGVRKLLDDKIIHRVFKRGERKDLYQAEGDFFQFFSSFFTKRWQREVSVNVHAIKQAQPKYQAIIDDPESTEEEQEDASRMLKKVTDSLKYYDFLDVMVDEFQSGDFVQYLNEKYDLNNR
ncbi:GbsR/MarR family transcriptional regulator [Alkalicoccobacillus murimartini]|uniref:HTH-type transcriptional regulator n=1 Tax=Alkalicoccobacillus murimartini TaxID=171685 RepID=A0ABT9YKS4_9BACI|nr:GbsR/MarR family transcriptional regulator [Alkalicoccobacillus murimartini]MDQ0208474.1 DNA-binding transcriptional regulator GbsR (MarR family) [Alkalicoccobacillus murimartini]